MLWESMLLLSMLEECDKEKNSTIFWLYFITVR